MILVRSPLRISFGGGGTDLPEYFNKYEGNVISTSINKYVYLVISKPFTDEFILKYSSNERVNSVEKIKHKIIKTLLEKKEYKCNGIEITSLADIPAGTGLGSSGAFSTALIKALNSYFKISDSKKSIASLATEIEKKTSNKYIGLQDQFASAYGGLNFYKFTKDKVIVNKINLKKNFIKKLDNNLIIFFTGTMRKSSKILKQQAIQINKKKFSTLKNLHQIKNIATHVKDAFNNNMFEDFGNLLHEQWYIKKQISSQISNDKIDMIYSYGIKNGAIGGKLLGAGAGGFLLFLAKDISQLRKSMKKKNILEVPFAFENEGTKIIYNNNE